MLQPDDSKLAFYSGWDIDKVVQEDTEVYTVAAGTPTDGDPPNIIETVSNKLGKKALVRASWSIDGTNFISTQATRGYYSSAFHESITKASVSVGCDAANVYFAIANNYTSSLTFTIKYAVYAI